MPTLIGRGLAVAGVLVTLVLPCGYLGALLQAGDRAAEIAYGSAFLVLFPLPALVLLGLERVGVAPPWGAGAAVLVVTLPALALGAVVPPVLPVALPVALYALTMLVQRVPTRELASTRAITAARERFRERRHALGRHYRWRVLVWSAPHLLLALAFLASTLSVVTSASLIGSSLFGVPLLIVLPLAALREGVWSVLTTLLLLAAVFATALLSVAMLVGLPFLTPLARAPLLNLLRALWPERPLGRVERSTSAAMAGADFVLLFIVLGFVATVVLAVTAPGVASAWSVVALVVGGAVLGWRILTLDLVLLTGEGLRASAVRLVRLVRAAPIAFLRFALGQLLAKGGVVCGGIVGAGAATALAAAALPPDGGGALVVAALVVSFGVAFYLVAPVLLWLDVHRLCVLELLIDEHRDP